MCVYGGVFGEREREERRSKGEGEKRGKYRRREKGGVKKRGRGVTEIDLVNSCRVESSGFKQHGQHIWYTLVEERHSCILWDRRKEASKEGIQSCCT